MSSTHQTEFDIRPDTGYRKGLDCSQPEKLSSADIAREISRFSGSFILNIDHFDRMQVCKNKRIILLQFSTVLLYISLTWLDKENEDAYHKN